MLKPRLVHSMKAVQNLYEAAKVLADQDPTSPLAEAVLALESKAYENDALDVVRLKACELYERGSDDNIEVDPTGLTHYSGTGGYWVGAWLWVPRSAIEADDETRKHLEYLRKELRAERISMGELIELQSLSPYIEDGDMELLEAAGVPEFPEEESEERRSDG